MSTTTSPGTTGTVRRVLQRIVLPADRDMDVLPLYVDPDRPQLDVDKSGLTPTQRGKLPPTEPNAQNEPDPHAVLGRHSYRVPDSQRISFGTYFNGFAASYWRRWTVVTEVALHVTLLAPLIGVANAFRMMRLPDPKPSSGDEGMVVG